MIRHCFGMHLGQGWSRQTMRILQVEQYHLSEFTLPLNGNR